MPSSPFISQNYEALIGSKALSLTVLPWYVAFPQDSAVFYVHPIGCVGASELFVGFAPAAFGRDRDIAIRA